MSKDVPMGYKLTEVGVIPEDWKSGILGDFWTLTDCKHITAEFVVRGYPIASIREVQSRCVDLTNAKQTTEYFYNLLIDGGRKPLAGDLILSRNATVGEIAQVTELHPMFAMGQDVCLLRKKSTSYSTEFLQKVFQSQIIANQFSTLMVGSTFKRANVEQIRNFYLPMPPEIEQRSIALVLSDTDALITSLYKLIAKKRDIKQAAMQQLLTGKQRLEGFGDSSGKFKQTEIGLIPEDWNIKRVGDICDFIVPGRNKPRIFEGDIPWITTPDLEDGRSVSKSRLNLYVSKDEAKNVGSKIVPTGSILMSCVGELGIVALTENEIVINQQLHAFIPSSIIDRFFLLNVIKIQKNYIEGLATKTAVPYLNKDNCNSIPILLPSLPEQEAIAKVLSDMDSEISALEQRRDKTKALKQAMMQELLTGRIRLL